MVVRFPKLDNEVIARYTPAQPFERNHCAVTAYAALAGKTTVESVLAIAKLATMTLNDCPLYKSLLTKAGAAYAPFLEGNMTRWASVAGIVWKRERIKLVRGRGRVLGTQMTLARFLRRMQGERKFLVEVSNHMLAVIAGHPIGYWRPGMIVKSFREVA